MLFAGRSSSATPEPFNPTSRAAPPRSLRFTRRRRISPLPKSKCGWLSGAYGPGSARSGGSSTGTGSRVKKDGARGRTGATSFDAKAPGVVQSQPGLDPERLVFIDEPLLQRRCRACMAEHQKVSGAGHPFRMGIGRPRRSPPAFDWAAWQLPWCWTAR